MTLIRTQTRRRPRRPARAPDIQNRTNLLAATIAAARRLPAFALILEGNALAPDFLDGDLLTISTAALPLPGDCVVALIGGSYRCLRINADGDLWDSGTGILPRGFCTLAGVVLERTPKEKG